jgi:hypothetical protein
MSSSPLPPPLEEVAAIDQDYMADLQTMSLWRQFHKDYLKRPTQMQ